MDREHSTEPRLVTIGDVFTGPRLPDNERAMIYNTGTVPIALRLRWGANIAPLGMLAPGGSLELPAASHPQVYVEGFVNTGSFWVQCSSSGRDHVG